MNEGVSSFGELEKNLRKEHELERVRPQDIFEGPEEERTFGMMHILARPVIEQVWSEIWESIEKEGGILASISKQHPKITETLATLTPAEACMVLSKTMTRSMAQKLDTFVTHMGKFQCDDIQALSTYMNYSATLALGGSTIDASKPGEHMLAGFKTGIVESWRMILESCRTFEFQFQQQIDAGALEEVTRNSVPLLTKAASTHLRIFSIYSNTVNNNNGYELSMCPDPSLFLIEGETPHRKLVLSSKLITLIESGYFGVDRKKFSGCPALYAKGVRQANVIEDLYLEMVIPAALHYLRPVLLKQQMNYTSTQLNILAT